MLPHIQFRSCKDVRQSIGGGRASLLCLVCNLQQHNSGDYSLVVFDHTGFLCCTLVESCRALLNYKQQQTAVFLLNVCFSAAAYAYFIAESFLFIAAFPAALQCAIFQGRSSGQNSPALAVTKDNLGKTFQVPQELFETYLSSLLADIAFRKERKQEHASSFRKEEHKQNAAANKEEHKQNEEEHKQNKEEHDKEEHKQNAATNSSVYSGKQCSSATTSASHSNVNTAGDDSRFQEKQHNANNGSHRGGGQKQPERAPKQPTWLHIDQPRKPEYLFTTIAPPPPILPPRPYKWTGVALSHFVFSPKDFMEGQARYDAKQLQKKEQALCNTAARNNSSNNSNSSSNGNDDEKHIE